MKLLATNFQLLVLKAEKLMASSHKPIAEQKRHISWSVTFYDFYDADPPTSAGAA